MVRVVIMIDGTIRGEVYLPVVPRAGDTLYGEYLTGAVCYDTLKVENVVHVLDPGGFHVSLECKEIS